MDKEQIDLIKRFLRYTSIPFELFVTIGGGAYLGYWIDKWLNIQFHLFVFILAIVGFFVGLYHILKDLKNGKK